MGKFLGTQETIAIAVSPFLLLVLAELEFLVLCGGLHSVGGSEERQHTQVKKESTSLSQVPGVTHANAFSHFLVALGGFLDDLCRSTES